MASEEIVKVCLTKIDSKTIVLAISIIVSAGISIFLYLKNRTYGFENSLNDRLFKIQDIAFNHPFLEDKKFINEWDKFAKKYRENATPNYEDDDVKKYLQYEQYCEMIFNLISDTYSYTKNEEKMLKLIDHKYWARTHKCWWKNPLEEHSNHDTYDKELSKIIDEWIK